MRFSPVLLGVLALPPAAIQSHAQDARARAAESVSVVRPSRARAVTRVVRTTADSARARAVLGLTTSTGGPRDTLGLLVTSIVSGSPAEQAGLLEGDRLVSINGVSLALSPADVGTREMRGLMGRRLQREMRKVKPGDAVHLRVYADGRTKNVDVKADSASAMYGLSGRAFFFGDGGDVHVVPAMPARPAMPRAQRLAPVLPRASMPALAPGARGADRVIITRERARAAAERARRGAELDMLDRRMRDTERARARRFDLDNGVRGPGGRSVRVRVEDHGDSVIMSGSGDSYVLRASGLQLTPVSAGLAPYFGPGSDTGLLVLNAGSWTALHAGDVILSVNGKAVREGNTARFAISRNANNTVDLLRKGQKMTVTVKGGGGGGDGE